MVLSASQELSQPGGSPDSSANRGIGKVYIVGDSITEGAESEYQSKLKEAGASDIKISASVGSNLDSAGSTGTHSSGIDSIKADKDYIKEANTIIVAHGTNNLSHTRSGDSAIRDAINPLKILVQMVRYIGLIAQSHHLDQANITKLWAM